MDKSEIQQKPQSEEQNDNLGEDDDEEEEGVRVSELNQPQSLVELSSAQVNQLSDSQLEPLLISPEDDQCAGLQDSSALKTDVETEFKEQDGVSNSEVSRGAMTQGAESQTLNQLQSSQHPTLSPVSVTQSVSSAPSPTLPEYTISTPKTNNASMPKADDHQSSSNFKSLSVPTVRTHIPDGYNWRKYGQKQVKSPTGSRSYYKCTYSDCSAKKIECADHSGNILEIVNKGNHSHDPPRKNNSTRESKVALSSQPASQDIRIEHPIITLKGSEQAASLQESKEVTPVVDKKRHNSSGSDENVCMHVKEEHVSEPEPKRRVKGKLEPAGTQLKPGKKPKFVVHAAGDVGISGDGYRWRKYGQKMVKGNPHPRNYYRCTSAGCPVRKLIETAVDNTSAVIITYKGVHDHDMPVPKKRHGQPSAPLIAAAAPASMNNAQAKKTEQVTATQWSVGKEGELTSQTLDVGGDKDKAIESARTLLSIGFEIKPC